MHGEHRANTDFRTVHPEHCTKPTDLSRRSPFNFNANLSANQPLFCFIMSFKSDLQLAMELQAQFEQEAAYPVPPSFIQPYPHPRPPPREEDPVIRQVMSMASDSDARRLAGPCFSPFQGIF
jgi:hypothetical protein